MLTFGVAGQDLVGPVATEGVPVEGQTLRTVEDVPPAVHAVLELSAVGGIAQPEVAVLVRTVIGGLRRLWGSDKMNGSERRFVSWPYLT